MTAIQEHFTSTRDFFSALRETAARGEKRDNILDAREYLRLQGIHFMCLYGQDNLPDLPTIVAINHYVRPFSERPFPPSILTTQDALATTAITTLGMQAISKRRITFLVQGDLSGQFLSFRLEDRITQQAAIDCYDGIPISEDKPLPAIRGIRNTLLSGMNLGIYPEAVVGQKMRAHREGFKTILNYLVRRGIQFQILPVGISYRSGIFTARFGKVIDPREAEEDLANTVMEKIAGLLPEDLRGVYSF